MEEKIDFVVTWVDGNDPQWQAEKEKYVPNTIKGTGNSINRYRDMKTLKYWFRSVEKYAPWVNKIYFVTWGHLPKWLNTNNEKLVIVNHKDFIPNENLPVFNSNSIEPYMHKIKGLSEQFVYFNDDVFIDKNVKPTDFFKNGKPRDVFGFDNLSINKDDMIMSRISFNNVSLIAREFNKKDFIKKNYFKIFNLKYGALNFRSLLTLPWRYFSRFYDPHVGISFLKSTFEEVWEKFGDELAISTKNRVRDVTDLSIWLFRYYQLLKGEFVPKSTRSYKYFDNAKGAKKICKAIKKKKYKMFCINDSNIDVDFDKFTQEIINAYEIALPQKSSFEI